MDEHVVVVQDLAWKIKVETDPPASPPAAGQKSTYVAERVAVDTTQAGLFSGNTVLIGDDAKTLRVKGTCPSCGHGTTQSVGLSVVAQDSSAGSVQRLLSRSMRTLDLTRSTEPAGGGAPTVAAPVVLTCRCGRPHPEAAADTFGCGSSWMLVVDTGKGTAEPPTDAHLPLWKDLADVATVNADAATQVREAAGKWTVALTGLVGATGVVAAVGGRDALAKLDPTFAWLLGGGVVVLLVLGAVAAIWSQLAATGVPVFRRTGSAADLADYGDDPLRQAHEARQRLREVTVMSLAGFVLAVVLLVTFWLAPDEESPAKRVDVTFKDGSTTSCVVMAKADQPRLVLLTGTDKGTQVRRWSSVASFKTAGAGCAS